MNLVTIESNLHCLQQLDVISAYVYTGSPEICNSLALSLYAALPSTHTVVDCPLIYCECSFQNLMRKHALFVKT